LLSDGAVAVRWPPAEEHPLEMIGVYRWVTPSTLDLEIEIKPNCDMPRFELFMSSYFTSGFLGSVRAMDETGARFVPINRGPDAKSGYVMFPRDQEAVEMIRDGRWKIPPNPVDWDVAHRLEVPLAIRRDQAVGLSAVMMCPPSDCFAIASPWNPAGPQAGGYRALYLSLFGQDLRNGETARARCRLTIGQNLSDEQAIELYRGYIEGLHRK
jgi:hypothetical protein